MKRARLLSAVMCLPVVVVLISCATDERVAREPGARSAGNGAAQVPSWSRADLDFFLHGSMSTEVVPEAVLRAFIRTYPDLFPSADLSHLGLIPDPAFGWPVGFSRKPVAHLGGLSSVGINCAACHVAEISVAPGAAPVRVLGGTAHFDAEAFFGSVIVATFRTSDPANLKRFLAAYLAEADPAGGEPAQAMFAAAWQRQEQKISAGVSADPFGSKGVAPGALHAITAGELRVNRKRLEGGADLAALAHSTLKLFHNLRAALHVPDQPPEKLPPASGPGRNDAFGLLSAALFGAPQPYSPVKYGLVWNVDQRHWVHWDGNTQSPLGRNLLAALGLGAPLDGKRGRLDFALVRRHTEMTEHIRPPRFPATVNGVAAARGQIIYLTHCASCHDGRESDARLHEPRVVGTDPARAVAFSPAQAARRAAHGRSHSSAVGVRMISRRWASRMTGRISWTRRPRATRTPVTPTARSCPRRRSAT
ncbi:MAG: hypothetical protein HY301_20055 [Verrucomicrobia bacterium]|nr:hypothetical protein [Verrucomicrobiota bacterium]